MAKEKKKTGRPPAQIDCDTFEKLCALQCTAPEIAGFFRVSRMTLYRWCKATYGTSFEDVFDTYRQPGLISLRRNQFRMAESNPTLAIFLGKQYLGQKDHLEQEISSTVTVDESAKAMQAYFDEQKKKKKKTAAPDE